MEKGRKDKGCTQANFTKKKSKIQLSKCRSPERLAQKQKDVLDQTKSTLTGKQSIFKSVSIGKKQKQNLEKTISMTGFHHKSAINTRYLTEALPTKQPKDCKKKLLKSGIISPERRTFQDSFGRHNKDRLSLNDQNKLKNTENSAKGLSTNCEQISLKELTGARKDIQEVVKKTCQKGSISKKDLLKITNQYETLLSRIVFSEIIDQHNRIQSFPCEGQEQDSSLTFRVEEKPKTKASCPGLSLHGIKKMEIEDYHDEFMAHYDELSESWKRDIAVQKRY